MKKAGIAISVILCLVLLSTTAFAWGLVKKSFGQTVYAPASVNWSGPAQFTTLSRVTIRNIDPETPITVVAVEVYDFEGSFVLDFLAIESQTLYPVGDPNTNPPNNIGFIIDPSIVPPSNSSFPAEPVLFGRPSFRIIWEAEKPVIPPLITTTVVVKRYPSGEGISVMSLSSRVIEERGGHGRR